MYYYYGTPYHMPAVQSLQVPEPPPCVGGTIYTVRPGDTMFRIANEFGITLQALIVANPQVANPNIVYPGQRICIPIEVEPPPPPGPFCPDGTIYTARRGDSLFSIARRFGITLQRMIQANPQIPDPNVVEVGQRICIPPPDDIPVPTGICRVNLIPQREGVFGGTSFINISEGDVWVATFGLPAPNDLDPGLSTYRAWVVDENQELYYSFTLKVTDAPGIEAGYSAANMSFEGYDSIIVTAEPYPVPTRPSGPVLLRGTIIPC
ncbi:LysM peptidoglycan-binding domain-containing protein [Alkaliphilus transvaalensis]|uniref:LysM peptidoglycan-binding domain-containing protein n=1 Tax=Alkaliphilus transvaalensis TaxID=114628 RepID=UPI001A9A4CEA|nr:LysM peptidoglycan-binding domain-containing protein [Alkaliphilus transvaalensis]